MHEQRWVRPVRAMLLVALGVQGLTSPLTRSALAWVMPQCVEASPVAAWAGTGTHVLMSSPDCPHGSYAPTRSYVVIMQAAFACSLTALVAGLMALVLGVGLGLQARQLVRSVRRWFVRRYVVPVSCLPVLSSLMRQPVRVRASARPSRATSRPQLRRGPPSCSC